MLELVSFQGSSSMRATLCFLRRKRETVYWLYRAQRSNGHKLYNKMRRRFDGGDKMGVPAYLMIENILSKRSCSIMQSAS